VVPRLAGVTALLFAATALFAQEAKTIKIEFAGEGTREVWIQDKGSEGTLPERTSVSGKAVEIEAPADGKGKTVFVHDATTGNVATKPLDQVVKAGTWSVKPADETHTFTLVFMIAHEGEPISAALVRLKAGDETRETLLTAKDEGMAAFFVVPYGDVEVTIDYESDGEDKTLPAQVFEAKAGMATVAPFVITIDDDVETIAPKKEDEKEKEQAAGAPEKKEDEPPKSNPVSTAINMLIGLLVIGGVSYAIWRYVQANPDKAADALRKGGAQVPGDPQGPTASPKKAGPPQQIILGDAAPMPTEPIAAAGPVVKNPRLVKADGSLYILQEGEQTVGREGGQLNLAGESSVSRSHAKLTRTGDDVTVEDLGSTNGTFVNGQRVGAPTPIRAGDSLQFGAVQYRYEE
jgi:hypothetical protein